MNNWRKLYDKLLSMFVAEERETDLNRGFAVGYNEGYDAALEKLAGVGQQAAEKIVDDFFQGESESFIKVALTDIAAIIDELVAGRLK